MRRFTSRYTNKVDKKGRVSVPATFRAVLEDAGASVVYLKRNQTDGALDGLTEAFMDEIQERIDSFPIGSPERDALEDEYFADSVDIRFDPEGRILLTKDLMDFAGITDSALFVGLGRRFQVWNPEAYEARRANRSELARNLSLPSTGSKGGHGGAAAAGGAA
jgi:MraZ protein